METDNHKQGRMSPSDLPYLVERSSDVLCASIMGLWDVQALWKGRNTANFKFSDCRHALWFHLCVRLSLLSLTP